MRILIVGGGGREHTLGWCLSRSPSVTGIASLPGNPGLAGLGPCFSGSPTDHRRVIEIAAQWRADLVVVGPEAPLAEGLADHLHDAGIPVFGPRRPAARIESSKIFAREFMARNSIPSAEFHTFTDADAALDHLARCDYPTVIKADGLAAGKGAIVCHERSEAANAIQRLMVDGELGDAGRVILVEEFLRGEEVSVFALTDGRRVLPMIPSQDHKAAFDDDQGPNTGGMGAYAPWPGGSAEFMATVSGTILEPTVAALADEGAPFCGCLYAGLMVTDDGPRVVEFNCRFGDPETQVVLPLLEDDLAPILAECAAGRVRARELRWKRGAALTVVLASGGYPDAYRTGRVIGGVDDAAALPGVTVFHAGTRLDDDALVTAGGRVLGVTAIGSSLHEARDRAYAAADRIHFDGVHMRRDIGMKGLRHVHQ